MLHQNLMRNVFFLHVNDNNAIMHHSGRQILTQWKILLVVVITVSQEFISMSNSNKTITHLINCLGNIYMCW